MFFISGSLTAQIYVHDFGTTAISGHPYTTAPSIIHSGISGPSWTNNTETWTSYAGSSGQSLGLSNSAGTASVNLTFSVATGKQLTIESFSFWRQRSNTGAQSWSMSINGVNAGSGTVPTSGSSTGTVLVANPLTNLTGEVTIAITLTGATGTGTFRLDDFTLNGSVTNSCISPIVAEIAPLSGPVNTTVTINGSGFLTGSGTSSVLFNGVEATSFAIESDSTIKASVPSDATSGIITVVTNGCPGTSSPFTVINSDCIGTPTPSDLYISELYDHVPGSYGVIELYNPTNSTIIFNDNYVLERYGNVGDDTPSYTLTLPGYIGPEMTYLVLTYGIGEIGCSVITNATMGAGINANDEFKLLKNNAVIDFARAPGNTGYTAIRQPDAAAPSITYNSNDWTFSAQTCADLGNHAADPVNPLPSATITTQPVNSSICANNQAIFTVALSDTSGFSYQWKVLDNTGAWINVVNNVNYSGASTSTLTINMTPESFNNRQFYCEMISGTCTIISNTTKLTVSALPLLADTTITQPTCIVATGTIIVNSPSGAGIAYSLDGINFQDGNVFANMAPGTYTITVRNAGGCTSTSADITINPVSSSPAMADVTTVQPTCSTPTGTITVNSPSGAGIAYSLDGVNFHTGAVFADLAPGTYTITVRNAAGCTSTSADITINPIPSTPDVANVTTVQPTCSTPTGVITINNPTGAGITYSLDGVNFQMGTAFAGLIPDTYNITVKNAAGCTSTSADIIINPVPGSPAVADVTAVQPTCNTPTGAITINNPTGADITYSIDGINFQIATAFADLAPGTYTITVRNADGCTSTSADITINPVPGTPDVANVTTVQPTCSTPNGTITVNSPTGAGITYSIDGVNFQTETAFAGLIPDTYNITVRNAEGCTSTSDDIIINPVPGSPAVADVTTVQPTCSNPNGIITVNSPTGTGITYSLDGVDFQSETVFAGMAPGTYHIIVKNTEGCISTSAAVTVDGTPSQPLITTLQECRDTVFGQNYILEVLPLDNSFDVSTATFGWEDKQGRNLGNESTLNINEYVSAYNVELSEFPLELSVTVTAVDGCEKSAELLIESYFCTIPRGISPNNDGNNDAFDLTGLNVAKLSIYNRYGVQVYARNNYINEWHGQSENNNDLPTGTYYYAIELSSQGSKTGWVYINRQEK